MKKFNIVGHKRGDYFKTSGHLGSVLATSHKTALRTARNKFRPMVVDSAYLAAGERGGRPLKGRE